MFFKYEMNKTLALEILNTRKGKMKNIDKQKYLCDFVNTQLGLKGICIEVIY